jgi:hypothetical protein
MRKTVFLAIAHRTPALSAKPSTHYLMSPFSGMDFEMDQGFCIVLIYKGC